MNLENIHTYLCMNEELIFIPYLTLFSLITLEYYFIIVNVHIIYVYVNVYLYNERGVSACILIYKFISIDFGIAFLHYIHVVSHI